MYEERKLFKEQNKYELEYCTNRSIVDLVDLNIRIL